MRKAKLDVSDIFLSVKTFVTNVQNSKIKVKVIDHCF